MSDRDQFDELIRLALHDVRTVEPTDQQITAAIHAARRDAPAKSRVRRVFAIAAATLALLGGTALAIPQTRDTVINGFGAFKDFLTGGGDPPGTPISPGDQDATLAWLRGTDPTNGTVIAENHGVRLVAYREPTTGMACFAYGTSGSDCRPDHEWTQILNQSPVFLTGPLPDADATGKLPLLGISVDPVTTIELRYAKGDSEAIHDVRHGFVIFADPARKPATLTARDDAGARIATIDIRDRQWTFAP